MSRSIINSIILGLIFIVSCGFNYYWIKIRKTGELKKLKSSEIKKQKEYDELDLFASQYEILSDTLNKVIDAYYESDKVLLYKEDSRITFEYLNSIASSSNSYLNFTFSAEQTVENEDYFTTTYSLNGDALFSNLYNFIWKLENYKRLYTIESLNLEEIKKFDTPRGVPKSYIKFKMLVRGYSSKKSKIDADKIIDKKALEPIYYNPFNPLVKENLPPNTENLLVVSNARLQGLTEDRAFIADSNGELKVLKVGDRVYLGYLTRINKARNQVEFTLNKGGFVESVILELGESK